eukprot:m.177724 g.177724  ORF g.177724 m.177724 type:complete len:78 (-) comp16822_c0_seq22:2762-2995(-)
MRALSLYNADDIGCFAMKMVLLLTFINTVQPEPQSQLDHAIISALINNAPVKIPAKMASLGKLEFKLLVQKHGSPSS